MQKPIIIVHLPHPLPSSEFSPEKCQIWPPKTQKTDSEGADGQRQHHQQKHEGGAATTRIRVRVVRISIVRIASGNAIIPKAIVVVVVIIVGILKTPTGVRKPRKFCGGFCVKGGKECEKIPRGNPRGRTLILDFFPFILKRRLKKPDLLGSP